jgi:tetratricopeptide (TPR) repeat protein
LGIYWILWSHFQFESMFKDFFFTVVALLLIFAAFLAWNEFWREYLTGRVQLRLGKPEIAVDHYKKALKKSPYKIIPGGESDLREEILELSQQMDWKVSESYIDALITMSSDSREKHQEFSSKSMEMLYSLGTELREEKRTSELARITKQLSRENPHSSLPYLFKADKLLLSGEPKPAIKAFEEAIDREPFYERALLKLVDLYKERRRYADIIKVVEPHQKKVTPSFSLSSTLGKAYFSSKQPEKAIEPLQKSLEFQPDSFPEHLLLGRVGEMLDKEKLADHLRQAWKLRPERQGLIKKWLLFQSEHDRHDLIVDFFEENLLPEEEFQVILLGSLVKNRNFEKFKRFLKHTPLSKDTHPQIQFFHGSMAFEQGDLRTAELEFKEYLKRSNTSPQRRRKSLELLMEIARRQDNPHLQRSYIRQVLQLAPDRPELYVKLGDTYTGEGKKSEALKAYMEALNFFPESEVLLLRASELLYENEAFFKLIDLLSSVRFLAMDPQLPLFLARSFVQVFDYESARSSLNRFILVQGSGIDVPEDLRFLLDEASESLSPPKGYQERLEEIQQREALFFRDLKGGSLSGEADTRESRERKKLGGFISRTDFSDLSFEEFLKMVQTLLEKGAFGKVVELLNNRPEVYEEPELAFVLARAQVKQFNYPGARELLKKIMIKMGNSNDVPEELNFLLGKEIPELPVGRDEKARLLAEMRKKEELFLSSLKEISTRFAKNTLPPEASLFQRVHLHGTMRGDYTYKGNGDVFIPEGRQISLIDALSDAQQDLLEEKEGKEKFYLARYRGKLHQIRSRYVNVIEQPEGDRVGSGRISNLDANYSTQAELEEEFLYGERLRILESTVQSKDKVMLFDDESYLAFFSVPKEGYSVQHQTRVYHHFRKDALKLPAQYKFLEKEVFAEIFEVPSESRLVLFGPEGGGLSIYAKETAGTYLLMHQIRIPEMIANIERYQRNYSRIDYVGSLIVDVNDDHVLDYLTLWRSKVRNHRALIHASVSTLEGKFRDFLLPTDLNFIQNYALKTRISLLNFLRDSDLDGYLEILVSRPFSVIPGKQYQVPWFEIFQIREDNLSNVSREFANFYDEQRKDLRRLRKRKESEMKSLMQYENWYAGYLKAIQRLQQLIGSS